MITIKEIAETNYMSAVSRGKINKYSDFKDHCIGINNELRELMDAKNSPSVHIPNYTERQEEAADVILSSMSYLYLRM